MMGDETFSQLAVNNSSDTLSQGYPGYYSPANRHHNSHQFHQQMGGGGGTYQSFGGGGGREEHTPDLLSAGELQQSITFHSPLWLDLHLDVEKINMRVGHMRIFSFSKYFSQKSIFFSSTSLSCVLNFLKISWTFQMISGLWYTF